ncbi:hypothetical protein SAMN05444004_109125 [Jannaschia faecimaris]|uniref:DNA cytosine methyltransferase n=1 Tax=Jannaschia faecimaris TaxID=1244108 RepID=A0A1H3RUJ0_9RHOB|nr:hypothetical protein [Jannaschia faecimaris]SDZ28931.1 hypothetical protein SAMN05444004_109125 [Jannaschia faecimaris]
MTIPLRVLIGCETSGVVRRAFAALGHDVWSCDIEPAVDRSNRHIVGDVRDVMQDSWDLMAVMHPPCTRLTNSGVRWLHTPPPGKTHDQMWRELDEGAALFDAVWTVPHIPRVAVENPVMHRHARERITGQPKPTQSVQPWHFGTDASGPDNQRKRTCFWLRGLPALTRTGTLDGTTARADVHRASPGPDRARIRSRFFPGMAAAMAEQWGGHATADACA